MVGFNNISNLDELMTWMNNNIKYGFIDINGVVHDNNLDGLNDVFVTRSADDAITSGYGTCIEQGKIIDKVLNKLGYKTNIYCSFSGPTDNLIMEHGARLHSFVIGFKGDDCLYFEHSNTNRRGEYHFNNVEDAFEFIKKFYEGNPYFKVYYTGDVPEGLSFSQLVDFISNSELIDYNKKNSL